MCNPDDSGGTTYYVPCNCGVDDPCEWAENEVCDEAGCLEAPKEGKPVVKKMFDDSSDCDVDGGR